MKLSFSEKNNTIMENKQTYLEALADLKENISEMLDLCDATETPTLCRLLTVEGNKERFIETIIELVKKGNHARDAIGILERRYNPNTPED